VLRCAHLAEEILWGMRSRMFLALALIGAMAAAGCGSAASPQAATPTTPTTPQSGSPPADTCLTLQQLVAIDRPSLRISREWNRVKPSEVVAMAERHLTQYKKMQAQLAHVPEVAVNDRVTKAREIFAQFIELQIKAYKDLLKGIENGDAALIEAARDEAKASGHLHEQFLEIYGLAGRC
jgi:hypothetical protein